MFSIDYPEYDFSLKLQGGKKTIFDIIRKKYVVVTPEEVVRQYIIHYLINERGYPKSLMAIEMPLTLNKTQRRCDIVIYKNNAPIMIIECKSPNIKLDQKVFDQIARYNFVLQVPYLLVSNGNFCYHCRVDFRNNRYDFIEEIPFYEEL